MPKPMGQAPVYDDKKRWYDYVQAWEFEPGVLHQLRPIGLVWTEYRHSVTTKTGKRYPEYCRAWDIENEVFYPNREQLCDCCRLQFAGALGSNGKKIIGQYRYFMNIIDLEYEAQKPTKPKSDWTPIFLLEMSATLYKSISDLAPINKGFPVTDTKHGAIIRVRFDPDADATKMYMASMDEKDIPITEEQLEYIAIQKFVDGRTEIRKSKNGEPAMYDYIRTVSSVDDMRRSLRSHGYFDNVDEPQDDSPAQSLPTRKKAAPAATHLANVDDEPEEDMTGIAAKIDQETTILDTPSHLKNHKSAPVEDDAPPPRPVKKSIEAPVQAAPAQLQKAAPAESQAELAIYDKCPSKFGAFAGAVDCFTKCKAKIVCRQETEKAKKVASASPTRRATQLDEDDTL